MKLGIQKNLLNNALINLVAFTEKKDASAVTSNILIIAKENILNLKATDFEIGLCVNIKEVNIQVDGISCVNGNLLLNILKGLKDGEIILEIMNNFLFIRQNRSKFKLPLSNPENFPSFESIENKKSFNINSLNFARSLKKIFPTIDVNNPQYSLNGALIDIKENYINLVGTDTKRLGLYRINLNQSLENNQIIIPKKAINEIQKLFFEDVQIYYDENILIAKNENFEFFTKLINKKFPNYEKVIPTEFSQSIMLPRDKFLEGMKTIGIICDKMQITIKTNSILFESISENNSEAKTEIDFENNLDKDIILRVTNKFIFDFLNNIEETEFKLDYKSTESALVLSSNEFISVIMPTII